MDENNNEMEELKKKLQEEENKRENKKIIIILLLLLLLIILIILWTRFIKKPTITLGEKDINTDYVEMPSPTPEATLAPTIIENDTTKVIYEITKPITIINNYTTIIQQIIIQTPKPEPTPTPTPTEVPTNKEFIVSSENKQWTETLSIFDNEKYGRNANNISGNRKYILF